MNKSLTFNEYGEECSAWTILHPRLTVDALGYLPGFIRDDDPRPAREQFQERYVFGGWRPMKGWSFNPISRTITYPGDPEFAPIAERKLRNELILLYASSWVLVLQTDGSFEIARMD